MIYCISCMYQALKHKFFRCNSIGVEFEEAYTHRSWPSMSFGMIVIAEKRASPAIARMCWWCRKIGQIWCSTDAFPIRLFGTVAAFLRVPGGKKERRCGCLSLHAGASHLLHILCPCPTAYMHGDTFMWVQCYASVSRAAAVI
jgi:hypothetical protein